MGIASVMLGAGRETKDDTIDMSAGIIMAKKTGDFVKTGDTLATLYSCNENSFENARNRFLSAIEFSDEKPSEEVLIYKVIQ